VSSGKIYSAPSSDYRDGIMLRISSPERA
jgi:hypothetical protein